MKDKVQALYMGILAIIGTLTHFVFFGYPLSVVFDETYFLKFVGQYWNATYFFDVHPPLGKLLFVLFAWMTGITPTAEIGTIHSPIDLSLTYFRLLPMISGILLPIVVFYICRRLHLSHWAAFVAGVLVCIENSLLVQSRFVLIDPILILSGFVFLWWYLIYRDHKIAKRKYAAWSFLILSAVAFACTISIKWNGLFFIVPAIVYELYDLWNWKRYHLSVTLLGACTRLVGKAILYTIITLSLYTAFFAVHFSLLTKSGPGDAFMTPQFQKTLDGSVHENDNTLTSPGFFGKFFELNIQMFESHTQLTQPHNYSSRYYTWPSMQRPIYYWHGQATTTSVTGKQMDARIYLIGNPFLYWFGLAAIICMIFYIFIPLVHRKTGKPHNQKALFFITGAYLANFLPYIFIGRVMFLYHYAACLVLSIMAIAYLLDSIPSKKVRIYFSVTFLIISVTLFLFFAPLTYGSFMTQHAYEQRVWFKSWK